MENLNTLTSAQKLELIKNPNTPDTTLIELVKNHSSGLVDDYAEAILRTHKKLSERVIRAIATQPISDARVLLASHPDLPEDLIRTFAAEDSMISTRIAERKNLSDDVKKILANNENGFARFLLVKNHELDTETAELLAADKDPDIRSVVAERYELSEKTLIKLGRDPDDNVISAIASRPDLPEDVIRTLAAEDSMISVRIAERENLSDNVKKILANNENGDARFALVEKHELDTETAELLAADKYASVRHIVAERCELSEKTLRKLGGDPDEDVRMAIARRKDLPRDMHETLVNDEWWMVRRNLALRSDLSEEHARKLASDSNVLVVDALAYNFCRGKEMPDDVIVDISKKAISATNFSFNPAWRSLIAAKEGRLPDEAMRILASGNERVIREGVAKRKDLPEDIIRTLAYDPNDLVRRNIARHKNLPDEVKHHLAADRDPVVRDLIAINENKKESFTETLSDEDRDIRRADAARKNPFTPEDVVRALGEDEDIHRTIAARKDPLIPEDVARALASVDHMPAKDEDIRRAVATSKDPLIPEDAARTLASIAKEGDTYPRVKGYNPSIEPLDEIFQKKCLESKVRRVGGKIMGMDDAMSKTIKEAQSSGKFSRDELLDYVDLINKNHNGALDKKSMYELIDKPLKPKPSDEITVDGIPIQRKDITPCPGSDFAVGRVTDTAYCLFNAKTNTPAGDRTTLYSYIDPEEHSGYHLVKTLPDERGNVSYNYIDHNGDKLCKKNLAFAKPFDSKGFAVVKLLGSGPLLIDNKSVVRQKAEVSTGVKQANTKGIKL